MELLFQASVGLANNRVPLTQTKTCQISLLLTGSEMISFVRHTGKWRGCLAGGGRGSPEPACAACVLRSVWGGFGVRDGRLAGRLHAFSEELFISSRFTKSWRENV